MNIFSKAFNFTLIVTCFLSFSTAINTANTGTENLKALERLLCPVCDPRIVVPPTVFDELWCAGYPASISARTQWSFQYFLYAAAITILYLSSLMFFFFSLPMAECTGPAMHVRAGRIRPSKRMIKSI